MSSGSFLRPIDVVGLLAGLTWFMGASSVVAQLVVAVVVFRDDYPLGDTVARFPFAVLAFLILPVLLFRAARMLRARRRAGALLAAFCLLCLPNPIWFKGSLIHAWIPLVILILLALSWRQLKPGLHRVSPSQDA